MKTHRTRFLFSLLTIIFTFGNTASISAAQVAQNSNWGMHFDMNTFKQSVMFEALTSLEKEGEPNKVRAFLTSKLNFDPRVDLDSITVYGNGQPSNVVVVLKGTFDAAKIKSVISQRENHMTFNIDGKKCHTYIDFDKKHKFLTFSDDNTLLISHAKDDLANALAIEAGDVEGLPIVIDAQASGTVFVTGFLDVDGLDDTQLKSAITRQVAYSDFMLTTDDDGIRYSAIIETVNETTANNFYTMANGFLALARMKHGNNPEKLAFINDSLKLSLIDKSLWITTEAMDLAFIQNALKEAMKHGSKKWCRKKE